jgi:hypothetical protein
MRKIFEYLTSDTWKDATAPNKPKVMVNKDFRPLEMVKHNTEHIHHGFKVNTRNNTSKIDRRHTLTDKTE